MILRLVAKNLFKSLQTKVDQIEQKTESLQKNFEGLEKNISDVLKTLESNCETWTDCINILQNLNEKQILLSFNPPENEIEFDQKEVERSGEEESASIFTKTGSSSSIEFKEPGEKVEKKGNGNNMDSVDI